MAKDIIFDLKARDAIKKGADALADAVKVTLGPKGRNVIIDKKFGAPIITKDGVTVAKEIELADPVQNMGAQLLKEAKETKDKIVNEAKEEAKTQASKIINDAQAVINQQKNAAINELKNQVGNLVIEVSEKVLRRELNNKTEQENYIKQVAEESKLN